MTLITRKGRNLLVLYLRLARKNLISINWDPRAVYPSLT